MLTSLTIRNFVLIEDASLEFGPGLTALTGETGAGKTLLTQALGLLMGERAADGLVGSRADEALIQAVFEVAPPEREAIPAELRELIGGDLDTTDGGADSAGRGVGEIFVTRRLHRSGRNRCYLNGTSVSLTTMRELTAGLLSFSGQHEYRRLLDAGYQRMVLDAFAGAETLKLGGEYEAAWTEAWRTKRLLDEAERSRQAREREAELLRYQVDELEAAALTLEEEEDLLREQKLLSQAEEISAAAASAAEILSGEGEAPDAAGLLALARTRLSPLVGVDAVLDAAYAGLTEVGYVLREAASDLRSCSERIVVDTERLLAVEQRLHLYNDLERKYGGSTSEAIRFLEEASAKLSALEAEERDSGRLQERQAAATEEAKRLVGVLTAERRRAAPILEQAVQEQLQDIGMAGARLVVQVETAERFEEFTAHGADRVEFLLSANPGVPPRSLARTASGGELSRTLLAVKMCLAGLEGRETLVFDEVDAGIGGRTATAAGRKLWELGRQNQVIVVTHLPQVAAFADHHYLIDKHMAAGETVTTLLSLGEDSSLAELARMMGGRPGDQEALAHARALKDRAASGLID